MKNKENVKVVSWKFQETVFVFDQIQKRQNERRRVTPILDQMSIQFTNCKHFKEYWIKTNFTFAKLHRQQRNVYKDLHLTTLGSKTLAFDTTAYSPSSSISLSNASSGTKSKNQQKRIVILFLVWFTFSSFVRQCHLGTKYFQNVKFTVKFSFVSRIILDTKKQNYVAQKIIISSVVYLELNKKQVKFLP